MITVIVPQFWKQRLKNLPEVIAGYEKVIIWNNDDEPIEGAINANKNYGPLARWVVGLLADTDYVLFLDNDIALPKDTVDSMLAFNKEHPKAIIGLFGGNLADGYCSYSRSTHIQGVEAKVDVALGRVLMMRKDILPKILQRMIGMDNFQSDDVIASLENGESWVIPGTYKELSEGGVGAYMKKDHYDKRDSACRELTSGTT